MWLTLTFHPSNILHHSSMAAFDNQAFLLRKLIFLLLLHKRRRQLKQSKRCRRFWVPPIFLERLKMGQYHTLIPLLRDKFRFYATFNLVYTGRVRYLSVCSLLGYMSLSSWILYKWYYRGIHTHFPICVWPSRHNVQDIVLKFCI